MERPAPVGGALVIFSFIIDALVANIPAVLYLSPMNSFAIFDVFLMYEVTINSNLLFCVNFGYMRELHVQNMQIGLIRHVQ